MKNKHKRQFLNNYKWFDHTYLLLCISDWCSNASRLHLIKGHHLNNAKVSRSLKIAAELATRLQEGCFDDTRFFGKILEQDHETSPIEGSDRIALNFVNKRIINKETGIVKENVLDEEYRKEYKRQIKICKRKQNETMDMFCQVFKKNLHSWWD